MLLLLTAWRDDRRALLLWGSIVVYTLVTLMLVSYGRFEVFGGTFTGTTTTGRTSRSHSPWPSSSPPDQSGPE